MSERQEQLQELERRLANVLETSKEAQIELSRIRNEAKELYMFVKNDNEKEKENVE